MLDNVLILAEKPMASLMHLLDGPSSPNESSYDWQMTAASSDWPLEILL